MQGVEIISAMAMALLLVGLPFVVAGITALYLLINSHDDQNFDGQTDQEHTTNVGSHTYKLGLNYFTDLTNEEYQSTYLGARMGENREPKPSPSRHCEVQEGEQLPSWID
ncbi:hypothetical protein EJ110_NYTH53471 [Nymphaea thermarum]|nr:hypothetical protein EJ110_NYTH53471 [Nymphaea thermarum]